MPRDNWEAAAHYTHTHTHTFIRLYSFSLTQINDWLPQKLWAVSSSSNRGFCVCLLTAPCRRVHQRVCCYRVSLLVTLRSGHLHTRGTARPPPGWQSLRWHVWGPAAWRWPVAVCSRRSAACFRSRWALRSHFLRSWLEVGSQVAQHSASWLSLRLLIKKHIQHRPVNVWVLVTGGFYEWN